MMLVVKNPPANEGDVKRCGLNPWVRKIPWRRAWEPTPVSCLENPLDRGAWRATVRRVAKRQTRLKLLSTAHIYTILFVYSTAAGHLGCFYLSAVVSSAVQVFIWPSVCNFFEDVPKSSIAGSYILLLS